MQALILAAITVAIEGLKLANTVTGRKYIDQLTEKRLMIAAEEDQGYFSDDAKLETFYKELRILMEASESEIRLAQAKS